MEQNKSFSIGSFVSDGKRIGKGAFATVFLGHHRDDPNDLVAIKVVDVERLTRSNQKLKRHLDSEINIMKTMRHEHIVTLREVHVGNEYIYLVLEFCAGGDFSEYLKRHKRLSEDAARYFLRQLASGLKYLHSKNIVHRDLKPQNLLLAEKRGHGAGPRSADGTDYTRWELKIADFGFARFIDAESVASTLCGSPLYMAPEVLFCQPYDAKADLWSVGAILYETLTGRPPFNVRTHIELVRILVSEEVKFPRDMSVSGECMDLLQALLRKNKEERITWREFFSHPFLARDTTAALVTFKPMATSSAIPISRSGAGGRRHEKRSVTIGSAPTNVGYAHPPSPPMAVGSPICASLPPHRADSNFISPPRSVPVPHPHQYYQFLTPSSLPTSTSPFDRAGGGFGMGSGGGGGSYSPPQFGSSTPPFGTSPSSPGSVLNFRNHGSGGEMPASAYSRSPTSSGGFGEAFGSGGWGSGPRKPLTNPFKESLDMSPLASALARSKEKESSGSASGGDDSFELLETDSVVTYTTPEEKRAIGNVENMVTRAAFVTELADTKVSTSPIEALALYIKALHIYHAVSRYAKRAAQAHHLSPSSRLGLVVERMKTEFKTTLKKAEYLKRNLKPNDSCPPAEKSIYDAALQMGRDGAAAEVLRNLTKAEALYVRSTKLLELLAMEANHPSDKAVLESYVASFEKRLSEVRKKQSALDANVTDSLTVTPE